MTLKSVGSVQNPNQETDITDFDPIESIATFMRLRDWSFETDEHAIQTIVRGHTVAYHACYTWVSEVDLMHFGCAFDLKAAEGRGGEMHTLASLVNSYLQEGHFEYRDENNLVVFRAGMPIFSGAICDAAIHHLLRAGLDACGAYLPVFMEVSIAGSAREVLDKHIKLFRTEGNA